MQWLILTLKNLNNAMICIWGWLMWSIILYIENSQHMPLQISSMLYMRNFGWYGWLHFSPFYNIGQTSTCKFLVYWWLYQLLKNPCSMPIQIFYAYHMAVSRTCIILVEVVDSSYRVSQKECYREIRSWQNMSYQKNHLS